ncbi:MAG: alpha/beta hydrolase [Methyloceanibacter sp.]
MKQSLSETQRSLTDLLRELEDAVRAGDRDGATLIEQTILQRLAMESNDRESLERHVRALMERLAEAELLQNSRFSVDAELSSGSSDEDVIYPVWFATNRRPAPQDNGYTAERYDRITRGRVEVHVPAAHKIGDIGTPFWKRLRHGDLRDDHLRVQRVERQERDAFFADIYQAMQAASENGEQPHALVFLHGFNVSFQDAAVRAAQIGCDLNVRGATAFFSWPSRGSGLAYPVDEASIEASEGAITDFLVDFTANCGAKKVHVIAHSMGNRGLLRALQRIAANAETRGKVKFDQIFLAAPDVDRDLFLDLAYLYPQHAQRTTLYASHRDLPVHLSSKVHDAPRAGYFTPYTVATGIDTVAVPNFNIDLWGHAYFAQADALLHDIFDLMRENKSPSDRYRIEPAVHEGKTFWGLKR